MNSDLRVKKAILAISLTSNLGLLAIFKYYNFFVDLAAPAVGQFGWNLSWMHHELLLPVGISFYTFQTMSYTIDLYRGEKVLEKDLLRFRRIRSIFPATGSRPHRKSKTISAAASSTSECHGETVSRWPAAGLSRAIQKSRDRRLARYLSRRQGVCRSKRIFIVGPPFRFVWLYVSDLQRFLGIQRYRDRSGQNAWF